MGYRSRQVKFPGFTPPAMSPRLAAAGLALIFFAQPLWADNGAVDQSESDAGGSAAQQRVIANAGFDELYVNAGADFTRYRSVLIEDASISFVPRWVNEHRNTLSNRDIARIRKNTADDLKAELAEKLSGDGRYKVVETAEIDTLRIKPDIVDLNIRAPDAGRNVKLVDSAGYATLSLEMVDAYSNLRVVKIIDRRETQGSSGREYFMANRASNAREFRSLMAAWASRVREQLDLMQKPKVPTTGVAEENPLPEKSRNTH